ncbi:MAG: hypothetical protein LBK43_08220 [Treponema sp.]|nr:hypothetical protein [Treponema sp.]
MDMVVLLDISSSMSGFYQEVSTYITGPLLKEFLVLGDTFHLISFSDKAQLEISRRIEGQGDLEVIIGRMLLLYPLETYSDISGSLAYTEGYISSIPGRRPKNLLLISDGDHNPPPGSPDIDGSGFQKLITDMQSRLSRRGVRFEFLKVPEGLNRRPAAPLVQSVPTSVPQTSAPIVPPQTTVPQSPAPVSPVVSLLPPASALQMPILILEPDPFLDPVPESALTVEDFPLDPATGEAESLPLTEEPIPTATDLVSPDRGEPREAAAHEEQDGPASTGVTRNLLDGRALFATPLVSEVRPQLIFINTGFGVLAALIILIIVFLVSRQLQNTPNRMLAHGTESPGFEGPPILSLFVKDQSTTLGRRNLHILKAGYSLSLGGGKSDFLIFLVPVPPHIARVYFDGTHYLFIPRKPQFFPDIDSQILQDCIGKPIRIISEKNYELYIRIERREDPWYALHRLLTSITLPG